MEQKDTDLDYVVFDPASAQIQSDFKIRYDEILRMLKAMPQSREASLARNNLEQSYMWCGKAIKVEQEKRIP